MNVTEELQSTLEIYNKFINELNNVLSHNGSYEDMTKAVKDIMTLYKTKVSILEVVLNRYAK
jgi:hypothetical protein